jgi:hypothetical protein
MISAISILLKKLQILFLGKKNHGDAPGLTGNIKQQISTFLPFGQHTGANSSNANKPTSCKHLENLETQGGTIDQAQPFTDAAEPVDPMLPPSYHQLEILKHFKIKNRSEITRIQANLLIKTIFSDPTNIEQWKFRPAKSKVKQGILFMGGQLSSGMTHREAQSKLRHYSEKNPQRFSEWKHVEALFLLVNSRGSLKHHNARKLTWKCFFQIYDDLINSGVDINRINADRIHRHARKTELAQKPLGDPMKTFAA